MSDYKIDPLIAGRVNASNYDVADMIAVINNNKPKNQVDTEVEVESPEKP